jgi:MFS family permease
LEVLDTTIVNVALTQMAGNLEATQQEISWVSTGYILSNVVVLPMTAFFTERFGRRRYLTASIILFAGARYCAAPRTRSRSWWSGASPTSPGTGTAPTTPTAVRSRCSISR